jgi:HAD superfamily hydrolase (TIGR01509 family)
MIKTIIFDLDGVLVDAKKIHYDSLNKSLIDEGTQYVIEWNEHLSIYDGLKTNQKLNLLNVNKGLPIESFERVWGKKQKYTLESLSNLEISDRLIYCMSNLSKSGYKIVCCSNSIRKTVLTVLSKLGIIEYFDLILSNEDVKNSKPHPEIFWKAISMVGCLPEETLIVEDSPYGLLAANRSHSNILRIKIPEEVNYENINNKLNILNTISPMNTPKWSDSKLNVLIPMAGAGSRFEKAGYTFPKPLIDINGKPMIQIVVDNLNMDGNFIFIVQKSHREKYNLDTLLNLIATNCKIVEVDGLTEGAACTTLLAKEFINNDYPLVIANSDQFVEWNSNEFMYKMNETDCDAGIVTFTSTHPKWSFVKLNDIGLVTEVAEKNPISDIATVGIYFWKKGSDYVKYAEEMIKKNIRVNNEFYVCPVFNQAILNNNSIRTFNISKMWGLGTPEDLNVFLEKNVV